MQQKIPTKPLIQTQQEAQMIMLYRRLSESNKQAVLQYFVSLGKPVDAASPKQTAE